MKYLTLKLGEAMLKSYSINIEEIENLKEYLKGNYIEEEYIKRITKEKYRDYLFDFKKLIKEVVSDEDKVLIRIFKLIQKMLGNDGEREVIKRILEEDGGKISLLLKEKLLLIEEVIKILSKEIINISIGKELSTILIGLLKGIYKVKNELDFNILDEELFKIKKRLKIEGEKNFITLYIDLLSSFKYGENLNEIVINLPIYCKEIYLKKDDEKREFKGFTSIILFILSLKEEFNEEEKKLFRDGLKENEINRIAYILSKRKCLDENLKLLKKIEIPNEIIEIALIKSFNPLNDGEDEVLKIIKEMKNTDILLEKSQSLKEDYVSLVIKGIKGIDINSDAYLYIKQEIKRGDFFKESLLNINKDEVSPFLLNQIENIRGELIYSKGLTLCGIFENPPNIFKEILSISYRANYLSLVSKLVKTIKRYRKDLSSFSKVVEEIISYGVPLKNFLKIHLIYLRYEIEEKDLEYLLKTYYREGIECYIEDGLYNLGEITEDLERYVGDKVLEQSIFILNSGKQEAVKYIVEKLRGRDEFFEEIKRNGNFKDVQSRKAIVEVLTSFNSVDVEVFLKELRKGETSKCIKDKINNFLLQREEEKIKESENMDEIIAYINSEVNNKVLDGEVYLKGAPKLRWNGEFEEKKEIAIYILLSYGGMKEVEKNKGIKFLTSKIVKEDLESFGDFLFNRWKENGALAKERWVLAFLCENISKKSIVKMYKLIGKLIEKNRYIVAIDCIKCLLLSESEFALKYLRVILSSCKNKRAKREIEKGFELVGQNRNISLDEVYDLAILTEELFDNEKYTLGEKNFKIIVLKGKIAIKDNLGNIYKQFPQNIEEEKSKKLNEKLRVFKITIRKIINEERERLVEGYKKERVWKFKDFYKIYIDNSILHEELKSFTFGIFNGEKLEKEFNILNLPLNEIIYMDYDVKITKLKMSLL